MAKKLVSADELIAQLNAAYEMQEGYDPENRFDAVPQGATGRNIRGYSTVSMWTPAHAKAFRAVHEEFDLDVPGGA